jgi:hypothetical protein
MEALFSMNADEQIQFEQCGVIIQNYSITVNDKTEAQLQAQPSLSVNQ